METWTIDQAQITLRFGWYLFNGVLINTHGLLFLRRLIQNSVEVKATVSKTEHRNEE